MAGIELICKCTAQLVVVYGVRSMQSIHGPLHNKMFSLPCILHCLIHS